MSNLRECLRLYRDDLEVNDEQFAAFILDAIDRDRDSDDHDTANSDSDPFADFGIFGDDGSKLREAARNVDLAELMTPEQSARYLLVQFGKVQETLDLLGTAIGGLNELDTKRSSELHMLTDRVHGLYRRDELRETECQALHKRIDNLDPASVFRGPLRPV